MSTVVKVDLPLLWTVTKDWLSAMLHLTHTDLHLVLGIVVTLLFGRLLRRPLTSWLPLLPVAVLEFINEGLDALTTRLTSAGQRWFETMVGVAATLLPSALIIAAARVEAKSVAVKRRG